MPALYRGDAGYRGVWEYFGKDVFGQDCVNIVYFDWRYVHVVVVDLLYEADGAVFAVGRSALVTFLLRKTIRNHKSPCITYPNIVSILKNPLSS